MAYKNEQLRKEYHKKWRQKPENKLKKKIADKEYNKIYWPKIKSKVIAKKHGISVEKYEEIVLKAEGKCAICKQEAKLYLDHNHLTGKIRGMLCLGCNTAIGNLRDSVEIVEAAKQYLLAEVYDV